MQQIRLKSNPPSKIEGVGGADVPKALFYIIRKIVFLGKIDSLLEPDMLK